MLNQPGVQLRMDLLATLERLLKATPERTPALRVNAGIIFVEEVAQLVLEVLFGMFKERGIYSKRATLGSAAWRPNYGTVDVELRARISPNLVVFAAIMVSGAIQGEEEEVRSFGWLTTLSSLK